MTPVDQILAAAQELIHSVIGLQAVVPLAERVVFNEVQFRRQSDLRLHLRLDRRGRREARSGGTPETSQGSQLEFHING